MVLVNRNSPQSDADDIWKSFAYYTRCLLRVNGLGQWPVVNGMTTPEYQMTQTGYRTIWESKVESSVALDQDLSFITKGFEIFRSLCFDTYNKNISAVLKRGCGLRNILVTQTVIWCWREYRMLPNVSDKKLEGDKRYYLQTGGL